MEWSIEPTRFTQGNEGKDIKRNESFMRIST